MEAGLRGFWGHNKGEQTFNIRRCSLHLLPALLMRLHEIPAPFPYPQGFTAIHKSSFLCSCFFTFPGHPRHFWSPASAHQLRPMPAKCRCSIEQHSFIKASDTLVSQPETERENANCSGKRREPAFFSQDSSARGSRVLAICYHDTFWSHTPAASLSTRDNPAFHSWCRKTNHVYDQVSLHSNSTYVWNDVAALRKSGLSSLF